MDDVTLVWGNLKPVEELDIDKYKNIGNVHEIFVNTMAVDTITDYDYDY